MIALGPVRGLRLWLLAAAISLSVACKDEAPPAGFVSIEKASEYQDPALLAEAWSLPTAAAYAQAGFVSQENPSLCGMASTVNVMKSLGQSPPPQKELILGTLGHLLGIQPMGVTLDELATIVHGATKRPVQVLRSATLAQFRHEMMASNDVAHRYVVNLTRKPLFGRGHGHFSPVGGYLPARDLVFVLDTNAEYKPFLVKTARLFEATDTVDTSSSKKRGLLRID